ncbi:hypothetical protein BDN71DRAFT_1482879 [Pleurotus eryngii]|uniref:Malate dehydrogenase n=1 Tax=Pleurotus eryngii TaxID=5323 RepID=A0A9P5ZW21_PLEER|nr:hypothetical protein BDN71DRAFT_1482879 [Pleurotus eryngii]
MIATPLFLTVIAASVVLAAPSLTTSGCDISNTEISLPPGLPPPTSPPSYVSVAIGVQNYSCDDTGAYTSVGAVAELFDISCLLGTPAFDHIQGLAFNIWKALPSKVTAEKVIELLHLAKTPTILGQHYFITNPFTGSGLSPKWDFTSQGATKGNPNAFVVGARSGGVPAPTGPQDIDWLFLTGVQGQLADQIYRVDTRGGQPPATCTPGSAPISAKYASKYWLFGGSIHQS